MLRMFFIALFVPLIALASPQGGDHDVYVSKDEWIEALEAQVEELTKEPAFDPMSLEDSAVKIENLSGSYGSGFYIGDNKVITARHVIMRNKVVMSMRGMVNIPDGVNKYHIVHSKKGVRTVGVVVYEDEKRDVAVLELNRDLNLTALPHATKTPQRGSRVYMMSNFANLGWSYHEGYTMNPLVKVRDRYYTTFAIDGGPGTSGAAIVNDKGEVVGMVSKGYQNGIASAVPVVQFHELWEDDEQ